MSIEVEERKERVVETGDNPRIERSYNVLGATDEVEAENAVRDHAPSTLFGLPQRNVQCEEQLVDEQGDPYGWVASVVWTPFATSMLDHEEVHQSVTIGGQIMNRQHALQVLETASPGSLPNPDFGGAIGVTDRGIEGMDVLRPHFEYELSAILPDDDVFGPDWGALFEMTATVNDAPYGIFAAGENLLKGIRARMRPSQVIVGELEWHLHFSFAAIPNVPSVTIGDITLGAKNGWDPVWIYYQRVDDDDAKVLIRRPRAAQIVRVYEYTDHNFLPV